MFGPCLLCPFICRPILSFCGIASHAGTVFNEWLVSHGRKISTAFSQVRFRLSDRFWPVGVQNRPRPIRTHLTRSGPKTHFVTSRGGQRCSVAILGKFGHNWGQHFLDLNLLVPSVLLRICRQNPVSGPCFLCPFICWPILSFCGIASHAKTVSNEGLVSPGRQKSPDFSRWPDRRYGPFSEPLPTRILPEAGK